MRPANEALLVVDIQNDFCPGGALGVPGGHEIVAGVNALMDEFRAVILTQDWHPAGHTSFASSHPRRDPYEVIDMPYGPQVLWPDHCIIGSEGARFHPDLRTDPADLIIRKGFDPLIDSYSAFYENDRATPTGLEGYLRNRGIDTVTSRGAGHRLLRELLGRRRHAARLQGGGGGKPLPGHRPRRLARRRLRRDALGRRPDRLRRPLGPCAPPPGLALWPGTTGAQPMVDIAARVYNHNWKIDPIVRSLLDTDFYKLLMCQSVFRNKPDTQVTFSLINRTSSIPIAADRRGRVARAARPRPLAVACTRRVDLAAREHLLRQAPDVPPRLHGVVRGPAPAALPPERVGDQYELTFEGTWPEVMLWEIPALAVLMELRSRAVLRGMGRFELQVLYARAMTRSGKRSNACAGSRTCGSPTSGRGGGIPSSGRTGACRR
jgi:nicotinamidase/pyrazinamidase